MMSRYPRYMSPPIMIDDCILYDCMIDDWIGDCFFIVTLSSECQVEIIKVLHENYKLVLVQRTTNRPVEGRGVGTENFIV